MGVHEVEHDIPVSGGVSGGGNSSRPGPVVARPAEPDEALVRQLDWDSPLSAAPPEES
ncbi:hypothetical protein ACWC2T_37770 [Streptomyces sp. NPDC001393]